eukprot:8647122-Alexandrium_andersonii.AAC.1
MGALSVLHPIPQSVAMTGRRVGGRRGWVGAEERGCEATSCRSRCPSFADPCVCVGVHIVQVR